MSEQQSAFSKTSPGLTSGEGSCLVRRRPDSAAAPTTQLLTAGPASDEGS